MLSLFSPVLFFLHSLPHTTTVSVVRNRGKFGEKLLNGSLTGALGNLQSKKSDIALTAFFMKVVKIFFIAIADVSLMLQ